VSTGDKLYLLGGLTATEDDDGVPSPAVYSLDTKNPGGPWIEEDDLPAPRYRCAAAWDGKRLVFAGGAETFEPNTPRRAAADIWELRSEIGKASMMGCSPHATDWRLRPTVTAASGSSAAQNMYPGRCTPMSRCSAATKSATAIRFAQPSKVRWQSGHPIPGLAYSALDRSAAAVNSQSGGSEPDWTAGRQGPMAGGDRPRVGHICRRLATTLARRSSIPPSTSWDRDVAYRAWLVAASQKLSWRCGSVDAVI
jgi:hypothetical protein